MLLEALLFLTTMLPRIDAGVDAVRVKVATISRPQPTSDQPASLPYFNAGGRAVSNWRDEAGAGLRPASLALVAKYSSGDPVFVARCVKLNNYWCIKRARWSGELGGDAEGHTGFATAADGADAAAMLLRRYYREYGRHSALAIVRRWAPAECGLPRPVAAHGSLAKVDSRPKVSSALAPRGIGGTLRARFLAGHARGGAPRRVMATGPSGASGLRVQPWSARARLGGHARLGTRFPGGPVLRPAADIATGILAAAATPANPAIGTVAAKRSVSPAPARFVRAYTGASSHVTQKRSPISASADPAALLSSDRMVAESAALPSLVAGLPSHSLLDLRVPAPLCGNDETRIRNYAGRIAASVGMKPEDDLALFDADGRPTERLAPVLLAMSWVELGSLRATPALVVAAIGRMTVRPAAISAAETTATAAR